MNSGALIVRFAGCGALVYAVSKSGYLATGRELRALRSCLNDQGHKWEGAEWVVTLPFGEHFAVL